MNLPFPTGTLDDAARLAAPGRELLRAIGRLAAVTAARLRLTGSLLGDNGPPGLSAAVLAAAIGGQDDTQRADMLLKAVPVPRRAADLLAHHGLASAVLPLKSGHAERVRDLSPLTGVLDRPGLRTTARCEQLLDDLRADSAARRVVALRFATPADTPQQARWRGECLSYIRHEDPEFVLDVYGTAFLHYDREHEIQARTAWRHFLAPPPRDAIGYEPTALWWRALAELEDARPGLVAARTMITGELRRTGTNLYRRVRQTEAA